MSDELTPEQIEEQVQADLAALAAEQAAAELAEQERLAEEARIEAERLQALQALQDAITDLGDIALLVAKYLEDAEIGPDDSWNPAGFSVEHINSNFGWHISAKSKPSLSELEELKDVVDSEESELQESILVTPSYEKTVVTQTSPAEYDVFGALSTPALYRSDIVVVPDSIATVLNFQSSKFRTQEEKNSAALSFLNQTDFIVVRATERGESLSDEFKAKRQAARDAIIK